MSTTTTPIATSKATGTRVPSPHASSGATPLVLAAFAAVYLLWGSTYLGIAIAVETIPPLLAVSTRFVAAGAIMSAVVLVRGASMRVPLRGVASCLVIGCLLPGANAVRSSRSATCRSGSRR